MDDLGHDHGDDGSATLATVARQPILDTAWDVIGFELLYRAAVDDGPRSPEAMTANVIVTGFSDIGLTELVSSRPAYLNVTRSFLLGMRPWHLPHDRIVLELEENGSIPSCCGSFAQPWRRGSRWRWTTSATGRS